MELLVSTGVAARLLGVSRQHVVNLCDRGLLTHVRIGSHRRVIASSLDDLVGPRLSRDQERSLWLHPAVAGRLVTDPDGVLSVASENLRAWRGVHRSDGVAQGWLDRWASIVDDGPDRVLSVLTSRSAEGSELRQNSPFAGVLDDTTRREVVRAFARDWSRRQPAPA